MKRRGILSGPRWARIESALRNIAWDMGLEIRTEADRCWLTETVRFEVSGPDREVNIFVNAVKGAADEWNNPDLTRQKGE